MDFLDLPEPLAAHPLAQSLAGATRLEVFRTGERRAAGPDGPSWAAEALAVWTGEPAARAVAAVQALPPDDMRRCFAPGYALRAHDRTGFLLEIAFCFRCHGAELIGPRPSPDGLATVLGFDAESAPALGLLARFRACSGGLPEQA
ncbi:hypothetical protein ACFYNO_11155 [Kitasatospora sp. NPDC006697]|uniref:hypothetical protein n=1 Tax=Kitasatospora sp. NPDC006697 TaxID=3364020 RepID=UPI0036ACF67A